MSTSESNAVASHRFDSRSRVGSAALVPFLPYVLVSALHVFVFAGSHELNYPTKLMLMPLLAVAALWASASLRPWPRGTMWLLVFAIFFSWLGDGAGAFFPGLPTLPMMLLCFGIAHLGYMWLFWRSPGVAVRQRLPWWALAYAAWWVVTVIVIGPSTGSLLVPVMIYGLVLGGTAALASRCGPVVAWGGFWFLASDTILAFRLFMPDALPAWAGGAVMFTYTLGQGLISYGVMRALRAKNAASASASKVAAEEHNIQKPL